MKRYYLFALFVFLLVIAPSQTGAVERGETLSVADALYKGKDRIELLADFVFAPNQQLFEGVLSRDPYGRNRGRYLVAFHGRLYGDEDYLTVTREELQSLHFNKLLWMNADRHQADILILGQSEAEFSEAEFGGAPETAGRSAVPCIETGELYRFTGCETGISTRTIYTPEDNCVITRRQNDTTILRTLIRVLVPEKQELAGADKAAIASCVVRGHYYHFGYSNVGHYGAGQFSVDRDRRIGMDLNFAPPSSPLLFGGELIGQSRAAFIQAIRDFERGDRQRGASKADARDAAEREEKAAKGRTYASRYLEMRNWDIYGQTRQFDRWVFPKGQTTLYGVKDKYVQAYYTGTLSRAMVLVNFNHEYLKNNAWGKYLMYAGQPEVADLMVVGVQDMKVVTSQNFREHYGWFLGLKETAGNGLRDGAERDVLRPDDHKESCVIYRVREGEKIISTLVAVKAADSMAAGAGSSNDGMRTVDCINRAHYFHYGFSNVGYQGAGVFADYIEDPDFPLNEGKGFTLATKIALSPPKLLRDPKWIGKKRDFVLLAYLKEINSKAGR